MSLSLEPVEPQADNPPDLAVRRRRRAWWLVGAVVLAVAVALIGFVVWLATGLKSAAAAVKAPATQARTDLTTMKTALLNGDQDGAKSALASAHVNLAIAEAAAKRTPVRVAAGLPVLSAPVADLRHLLKAARDLVNGGDLVVALYQDVSGADSTLFRNSAFDLPAVHKAGDGVRTLMTLLDDADAELKAVRGGRLAPGAAEARDSGLAQTASLRKDARPLVNILAIAPTALGESARKCYLVTLQNQAELRPGGGAPLSLTTMCFDKGAMSVLPAQATLDVSDGNAVLQWEAVKGNAAWHPAGKALPFASANFAPDWPTSGEELLRAYTAMTRTKIDGVIGIDVTAMAAVLKSTGSALSTSDYGVVTSDTLAQTLLIDAYRKFDIPTRRKNNEELMAGIVSRLIGGGQLASKFRALAATSPGRHMLMYFRDKDLEALVAPTAMAGRLDPGKGDFIAVYTNNTNASKVDVYQARTVTQDVVYGADGSATVTRSVTISNNSPPYRGKTYARDPGEGYETTFSLPVLATYVPPGARVRGFEVSHSPQAKVTLRPYAEDKGMRVLLASANLPRSNSMTAKVTYLTRPQNNTDGYHLRIISQATLLPAQMTISVQPPPGAVVTPTAGWSLQGDRWTTTLSVTGDVDIVLPFTRG